MSDILCRFCGCKLPSDAYTCERCGSDTNVDLDARCLSCGSFLKRRQAFVCASCGAYQRGARRLLSGAALPISIATALLSLSVTLIVYVTTYIDIFTVPYEFDLKIVPPKVTVGFINDNKQGAKVLSADLLVWAGQSGESADETIPLILSTAGKIISRDDQSLEFRMDATNRIRHERFEELNNAGRFRCLVRFKVYQYGMLGTKEGIHDQAIDDHDTCSGALSALLEG